MKQKLKIFLAILLPIFNYLLVGFCTYNPILHTYFRAHILNILLFEGFVLFLWAIFGKLNLAFSIETVLSMIFGLAFFYVYRFKNTSIMPWDIFSFGTAMSVAGNYDFTPDLRLSVIIVCFILVFVAGIFLGKNTKINIKKKIMVCILGLFMMIGVTTLVQNQSFVKAYKLYSVLFYPDRMTYRNGTLVGFLMEIKYMVPEKPEGYDKEAIEDNFNELVEESESSIAETSKEDLPNIIVVMNETFADLSIYGSLNIKEDVMPFVRSLNEKGANTKSGTLNVSVFGGNTANSEFEFLTNQSMNFYPEGSIPYQQYIWNDVPNLTSYLKELGYTTTAIHPFKPGGWSRNRTYPFLGFDEFLSEEDFENPTLIREYISDASAYDKVIELFEKKSDDPMFTFLVTMQNHGGYTEDFPNFNVDVFAANIRNPVVNRYLSLIKYADQAVEELISYFENVDEDTIIVFFGDHQPAASVTYPVMYSKGIDVYNLSEEEEKKCYKVPYFIWANFDIEEEHDLETSANYLSLDLMDVAGIDYSPFMEIADSARKDVPLLSSKIRPYKETDSFDLYRDTAYYLLFDYGDK
ncbi:MAG: LTA synthase family protein [Lachnospiraceae bacterium]|nr:LTA synthase family protein [Lachnospiraceae bacterium]